MSLLSNSVSGLLAAQRGLTTTGHNIANANTDGYNRQRVEQGTRPPQASGAGFQGQGTQVTDIRRMYDTFLAEQLRNSGNAFEKLDTFHSLARRVDDLMADSDAGLTPSMQRFFNAMQEVADDPASIPARQVLLSEAEALTSRFDNLNNRLSDIESEINGLIRDSVKQINGLTEAIARLNEEISRVRGQGRGEPNDLLDQRDHKIQQLSEIVNIDTQMQDDGSINVFLGNGPTLVLGNESRNLEARQNPFDPSRQEVAVAGSAPTGNVSSAISGGKLGGVLAFRDEVLDSTRNGLGRLARGITENVNAVHREGLDLNGAFGGDFFAVPDPQVSPRVNNTGGAELSAEVIDTGALTQADYRLRFDGGTWTINRLDTGEAITPSGDGSAGDPFVFDGLSVVVDGAPDDGDEFIVRPNRDVIGRFDTVISNPREVAAAAPIIGSASTDNLGTATISLGEVVDIDDPDLMEPVTIEFIDANTFEIDGNSFAYTSGEAIEYNGWRVTITGSVEAGDTFSVDPNIGGTGDNRNARRLADLVDARVLDGGTTSFQDALGEIIADVGSVTAQAESNRDAQKVLRNQAMESMEAVSGVNLDEEAANLLKYQQAFQASAQAVRVADTIFQTLIGAFQR
ncbi:flagellar hook-associated protein FlgK [Natronospira bacteriovora]|uniref:Flagellar hook-associated protein 1 n=1 Tax=Natronospira bacteriovora TaxID=3069753 RepID=A0ABU0W390_9GAMM|nr:flagellar hook-associated protein FlgK [Natronospira sp. AB-CW4]MDQ2068486.1 flagellar hook-associated protein FlgK [Natronospira sp. AB-CW4]